MKALLVGICCVVLFSQSAYAQAGNDAPLFLQYRAAKDDSVASFAQRGDHFAALSAYYAREAEATLTDKLSAAKSAWALGLGDVARTIWDEALASPELQGPERSKTLLAYAILNLQEERYDEARRIAETTVQSLEQSELRSQFWLVIAEALNSQNVASLAEGYYKKAVADASDRLRSEALFSLAECQLKLGNRKEARKNLTAIDMPSEYTARALRRLVEIDSAEHNPQGVAVWIKEGRTRYPTEFHDEAMSLDYIDALLAQNQFGDADNELRDFKLRHTDQSPWYEVARASIESAHVQSLYPRARLSPPVAAQSGDNAEKAAK